MFNGTNLGIIFYTYKFNCNSFATHICCFDGLRVLTFVLEAKTKDMKKLLVLLLAMLFQAAAVSVFAQHKSQVGDTISGIVYDEYGPVPDIGIIEFNSMGIPFISGVRTDADGKFSYISLNPEHVIHIVTSDVYEDVEDIPIDKDFFEIKLKHRFSVASRMRMSFGGTSKLFLPQEERDNLRGKVSSVIETRIFYEPYIRTVLPSDMVARKVRTVKSYNKEGQLTDQEETEILTHADGTVSINYKKKTTNTYKDGKLTEQNIVEYRTQPDGSVSEQPNNRIINIYRDGVLIKQTEQKLWLLNVPSDFKQLLYQTDNDSLLLLNNTFVQDFIYDYSGELSSIIMSRHERGRTDSVRVDVRKIPGEKRGIMLVWGDEGCDRYLYDSKGRLLEKFASGDVESIDMNRTNVYNRMGDLEKTLFTDSGDSIFEEIFNDYEYDRKGNWIKKTLYNHAIGYKTEKVCDYTRIIEYRKFGKASGQMKEQDNLPTVLIRDSVPDAPSRISSLDPADFGIDMSELESLGITTVEELLKAKAGLDLSW